MTASQLHLQRLNQQTTMDGSTEYRYDRWQPGDEDLGGTITYYAWIGEYAPGPAEAVAFRQRSKLLSTRAGPRTLPR
jgi:hypothetical protein